MNILKYEKIGNIRNIKIFKFIKILFNKEKRYLKGLKVKDIGRNNIFKCKCSKNVICKNSIIIVKGNNNSIEFGEDIKLINAHIEIWGNNVVVNIGKNCSFNNFYGVFSGSDNPEDKITLSIGDNFFNVDDLQIFIGGGENTSLEIGKDCLFSRRIAIYAHDGHKIYDKETGKLINIPKNSLKIGNHVWVGHGVNILKGSCIPNNTVVGSGSIVTGRFTDENTSIAGNPAKVIKRNILWET